ncbi:MAG: Ca2+-binding EF-hand superfamily protein [Verrucomicrobiales bacterium]|jgi:Ca2+-binding EF-hand superfamily protein
MKPILTILVSLLCRSVLVAESIQVPQHYETIQAAIDEAETGDTILVAPGNYRERIALKPGILVRSVGQNGKGKLGLQRAEATIIDGGGEGGDSPGVTMAEGATLDGFTITRVGGYDDDRWQKSWDEKGENQSHDHIGNFEKPGISISGITCKVTNNIVHHNGATGIAIRGEEGKRCAPLVSGNVCYRNMGGGIGSMIGSTATIDGNTSFENFYAGIGHNGADPVVTRNVCYNNVRAGIGVSEGASPVVRKNRCYGNRRAGIAIRTGVATRPVIEDNDCYENEMAGIGTEAEAAPIIRDNRCYRNKLAGIGCREQSTALIVDNHCYENEAAGIGVSSATPLILGNRLEKNETAGIGISGDSKARLLHNTCVENRLVAVGIPDGSEAFLQNNTLVRTGGMPPIIAILGGSKAVLIDNTIKGGGIAGILLEGRLDAIGNAIEGQNGGAGILARENSEVTLTGNRISGYRNPVSDQGAKSIVNNDKPDRDRAAGGAEKSEAPAKSEGKGSAASESGDGRPPGGDGSMFYRVFVSRNDKNADGVIDKSEFRGGDERFGQMDKNKNGKLDRAEIDALHRSRMADPLSMRERIARGETRRPPVDFAPSPGSGTGKGEDAAQQENGDPFAVTPLGTRITAKQAFARLDVNTDGKVTATEFQRSPGMGDAAKALTVVQKVDQDGDGNLSFIEFDNVFAQRHGGGTSASEAADETSPGEKETFKVIGYQPSWAGDVDGIQYDKLTHINYSFILPKSDGTFKDMPNPAMLTKLVKLAHVNKVKVGIAIGGWNGGNDSAFEELAASPETRNRFVRETMKMVETYGLDGVDMDWEYPDAGDSSENFLSLMRELSAELRREHKYLSAAVVSLGRRWGV